MNEDRLETLERENNAGYGLQPLPSERDQEISELLSVIDSPTSFQALLACVTEAHTATLTCYAERMASLSVRERDRCRIELGMTALAMAGLLTASRDVLLVLPLLWDAAARIGLNPGEVFGEVGSRLGLPVAQRLREFRDRSDEDRSISAMGYSAVESDDGFKYDRDW